jgi:hypothetical protein
MNLLASSHRVKDIYFIALNDVVYVYRLKQVAQPYRLGLGIQVQDHDCSDDFHSLKCKLVPPTLPPSAYESEPASQGATTTVLCHYVVDLNESN